VQLLEGARRPTRAYAVCGFCPSRGWVPEAGWRSRIPVESMKAIPLDTSRSQTLGLAGAAVQRRRLREIGGSARAHSSSLISRAGEVADNDIRRALLNPPDRREPGDYFCSIFLYYAALAKSLRTLDGASLKFRPSRPALDGFTDPAARVTRLILL
jgi:hypothetical protein